MKKLILLALVTVFFSCSHNDIDLTDDNYVFNGRGGIKCKVNGTLLEPTLKLSPGPGTKNLVFDYYNNEYYMSLSFYNDDQDPNFIFQSVRVKITDITPENNLEGNIYNLADELDENYGNYLYGSFENYYSTNEIYSGELEIVYHDIENRILGGIFWFDAINQDGDIVEIRDGELDMNY